MGGVQSNGCNGCRRRQYQLDKYLNARQIHLVQTTWSILKLDLTTLGLTIFLNLFDAEPDLKMVFPKMIRMNESSQLEWDVDRDMLQKHAVTVMEGLGAAVETLHDSQFLNKVLMALGQTHDKRNVKPYMLKKMWPSLQVGLSTMLGEGYTKEVNEAWRKLYTYICMHMREGMENPEMNVDFHDD